MTHPGVDHKHSDLLKMLLVFTVLVPLWFCFAGEFIQRSRARLSGVELHLSWAERFERWLRVSSLFTGAAIALVLLAWVLR